MDPAFGCFATVPSSVRWRVFSADAFTEAEQAAKPIFLFVGASWCPYSQRFLHWLQSDAAAGAELNDHYVPILVDGERRPDVHHRYPAQGWPGIQILEPGGELFWASTHVPPGQLARLLAKVRDYFRQNQHEIRSKAQLARGEQRSAVQPVPLQGAAPLSAAIVDKIAAAAISAYDADNAGFALEAGYGGPKFPHFDAIDLLLSLKDDASAATIVRESLDALMTRGLWDLEHGGLRRYAAGRDWSRVHGETLLLDNARLLDLLCRAGQQMGDAPLLAHARTTLAWCRAGLGHAAPRFAASIRPGHDEVPSDWPVPVLDETVFLRSHAVMVSALCAAARSLGDTDAAGQASAVLDLLWERGREADGWSHYLGDSTPATLADLAALGAALLDGFEYSGEHVLLERAELVMEAANKAFKQAGGAFFDVVDDRDAVGRCCFRSREAGSNAEIARLALRLHALTRTDWYRETALEALAEFARLAPKDGILASGYASAVRLFRDPVSVAIVVGPAAAHATRELHAAALRLPTTGLAVQQLDPLKDLETLTRFGIDQSRDSRAFLCRGHDVLGPWRHPQELEQAQEFARDS